MWWHLQDESCIAGHLGERAPKSADGDDSLSQSLPGQDAGVPSGAAPSGANGAASASEAAGQGADGGEGAEEGEEADADGAESEGTPSEQARCAWNQQCCPMWSAPQLPGACLLCPVFW